VLLALRKKYSKYTDRLTRRVFRGDKLLSENSSGIEFKKTNRFDSLLWEGLSISISAIRQLGDCIEKITASARRRYRLRYPVIR
jgi:hypothetical protein